MEYNTQLERLKMSEYGRCVQQMVEHCKTITDRNERLRCARTIIKVMETMIEDEDNNQETIVKLWNHLAQISNYELDIDYPVAIERHDEDANKRQRVPYPKTQIGRRNYGHIVESFTKAIKDMEDEKQSFELAGLVANQMKRDLGNWNVDVMSDDKVADDMARYTEGKILLNPKNFQFITDGEILSNLIPTSVKKKRKK